MDSFPSLMGWIRSNPQMWGWIALGSLGLALVYAAIIRVALTRMNPDYFSAPSPAPGTLRRRHPLLILVVKVFKTAVGLALLSAGIGMLLLPGQGLLTIAIGITFLEFPGKRRLLSALVFRGRIKNILNRIREKSGKEPFLEPGKEGP